MSELTSQPRRTFLGQTAIGVVACTLATGSPSAFAQAPGATNTAGTASAPGATKPLKRLEPLKHVSTRYLSVAYYEVGPADGPVAILLHGYPYDIHSFVDVAPMLAAKGMRVIVPYLRGHGETTFLSKDTMRSGQQAALGSDLVELLDALKIESAVFAGYDWGGRAACIAAALWPDRCKGLVTVNSYNIQDIAHADKPIPPMAESGLWYIYYFQTERGRLGLKADAKGITRVIWTRNSPTWRFDEATLQRTADAFNNPDYVDVVIHSYRHRMAAAKGDPAYDDLEKRLAAQPAITVRSVTLDGEKDGVIAANDGHASAPHFTSLRTHHVVPGVGHNLPQEAPVAFVDAVLEAAGMSA